MPTLNHLPETSGVYLLKNEKQEIIYIGKAKNLQKRVKTHFQEGSLEKFGGEAAKIDYIITASELEALILESNLIKRHRPRYNIKLRDDKKYPYLKISSEEFPSFSITRQLKDEKAKFFGPYPHVKETRRVLDTLRRIFLIRTCQKDLKKVKRPCLNYHLKRCCAPCTGRVKKEEYQKIVKKVHLFLAHRFSQLIKNLEKEMKKLAEELAFEEAAFRRDQINSIRKISEKQRVVLNNQREKDLFALKKSPSWASLEIFSLREGKLLSDHNFILTNVKNCAEGEILASFIKQFYLTSPLPEEVVISHPLEDQELILEWLREKKGEEVKICLPERGELKNLMEMALANAEVKLRQLQPEEGKEALSELAQVLKIKPPLVHIEAFDISNFGGKLAVGSLVVFEKARPVKEKYRRYKIKTVSQIDDYAMLREILRRHYRRVKEEKLPKPDLILLDGGRGHLQTGLTVLKELKLSLPLVSLAKQFEEVYSPERKKPVVFKENSPALKLLQQIRDEAHRFAQQYHRYLRRGKIKNGK